jgi:plastocyanin
MEEIMLERTGFLTHALLGIVLLGVPGAALAGNGSIAGKVTAEKAKYLENAVVYLDEVSGTHAPTSSAHMDQVGQVFTPFILPVVRGTTVQFLNNDNTEHNVNSPDGAAYDLGTKPKGESATHTFDTLGVYTQLCNIHPSMIAYVVVLQNPYFAITGADGTFQIADVPEGTYTIKIWHERREGDPASVTVVTGQAADVTIALHK